MERRSLFWGDHVFVERPDNHQHIVAALAQQLDQSLECGPLHRLVQSDPIEMSGLTARSRPGTMPGDVFDGTLAWSSTEFNLVPRGEAQIVSGAWVSGSYFETEPRDPITLALAVAILSGAGLLAVASSESADEKMVRQICASWNQMVSWLR